MEFWTDAIPAAAFVGMMACCMPRNNLLVAGVFVGVIVSRVGSTIYHAHTHSEGLLKLDRLGICCMALGSPWLFRTAGNDHMAVYLCILGIVLLACANYQTQPLFIALATLGNLPSLQISLTPSFPTALRVLVASAVLFFIVGYGAFYIGKIAGDMSHALWHVAAQLCYIVATIFYSDPWPTRM